MDNAFAVLKVISLSKPRSDSYRIQWWGYLIRHPHHSLILVFHKAVQNRFIRPLSKRPAGKNEVNTFLDTVGGGLWMNPGSCGKCRGTRKSYALGIGMTS